MPSHEPDKRADSLFYDYYWEIMDEMRITHANLRIEHNDDELRMLLHRVDAEISQQDTFEKNAQRALASWTQRFARRSLAAVGMGDMMSDHRLTLDNAQEYKRRLVEFRKMLVAAVAQTPLDPDEKYQAIMRRAGGHNDRIRQIEENQRITRLTKQAHVPADVGLVLFPLLERLNRESRGRATGVITGHLPLERVAETTQGERALIEGLRELQNEKRPIEMLERWTVQLARQMSEQLGKEVRLTINSANGVPDFDDQNDL